MHTAFLFQLGQAAMQSQDGISHPEEPMEFGLSRRSHRLLG
jgi:hypothetical protein